MKVETLLVLTLVWFVVANVEGNSNRRFLLNSTQKKKLDEVKKRVKHYEKLRIRLKDNFSNTRKSYRKQSYKVVDEVQDILKKVNKGIADDHNAIKAACNKDRKGKKCQQLLQKHSNIISQAEKDISSKVYSMYTRYKRWLEARKAEAKKVKKEMDKYMEYMGKVAKDPKYKDPKNVNFAKDIFSLVKDMEYNQKKVKSIPWNVSREIAKMQNLFYGNACFRFDGADHVIRPHELPVVNKALSQALTMAAVREGLAISIQSLKIIKQQLQGGNTNRKTRGRALGKWSRSLKVGAITAWFCNCDIEKLVHDTFSFRSRNLLSDQSPNSTTDTLANLDTRINRLNNIGFRRELWSNKGIDELNAVLLPMLKDTFPDMYRVLPIPCEDFLD